MLKYNKSIIGDKYGMLTVLSLHSNINYRKKYNCLCDCGNTKVVTMSHLRTGHTKTCGCVKKSALKHGDSSTSLYKRYYAMLARCNNKQDSCYPRYGAKGIKVCKEWEESYEAFKEWALNNGYSDELTIDRIDGRLNYTPDNCRWVTYSIQAINKDKSIANTSGHIGVSYNKSKGKWVGRVVHNGKRVETGSSTDLLTAVNLRQMYIQEHNLINYKENAKYDTPLTS